MNLAQAEELIEHLHIRVDDINRETQIECQYCSSSDSVFGEDLTSDHVLTKLIGHLKKHHMNRPHIKNLLDSILHNGPTEVEVQAAIKSITGKEA